MSGRPRVLLTGAFGYLGASVLRRLQNVEFVATGRSPRNAAALEVLDRETSAQRHFIKVEQAGRLLEEHGPFDAVVHLAGGGGPAKIAADPIAGIRNNIRATSILARAAARAGVKRLLFASTIAVYGTSRDHGKPYAESDTAEPDDIYGVVKETAEQIWVEHAGGTSLRLSNIYGAGIGVDMGILGAVERFAKAAAEGGTIKLFGGGTQRIDYVHVDDVARAIGLAISADELPPLLNLGGGSPIALADLAALAVASGEALGKRTEVVLEPAPPGKSWPDRSLAIDLAGRAIGFVPRVSYEAGMDELVRMFASGPKGDT